MATAISQLLVNASPPIAGDAQHFDNYCLHLQRYGKLGAELAALLKVRNGFWSYGGALLARPLSHSTMPLGILEWNAEDCWKCEYGPLLRDILCFAEDSFGCQYCIDGGGVVIIDPETADSETIATSLEEWASIIVNDTGYRTGLPLLDEWQQLNGALPAGMRLLPKRPFVLGGEFAVDNLYSCRDMEGMRFRASLATQIVNVQDGEQIVIEIVK